MKIRLIFALFVVSLISDAKAAQPIWDSNDFLVAGYNSNNIVLYDENFVLKQVLTSTAAPIGLAFSNAGNVLSADGTFTGTIREYSATDGSTVQSIVNSGIVLPYDIKVASNGNIFVAGVGGNPGGVFEFIQDTTFVAGYTAAGWDYRGIAVVPGGELWAGVSGGFEVFDIGTALPPSTISYDNGQQSAGTMYTDGSLVFSGDYLQDRIFIRNLDGSFVQSLDGIGDPFGITRGAGGDIFATSSNTGQVFHWSPDGTLIGSAALSDTSAPMGILWTGSLPIPEASGVLLFLVGIAATGFRRLRS